MKISSGRYKSSSGSVPSHTGTGVQIKRNVLILVAPVMAGGIRHVSTRSIPEARRTEQSSSVSESCSYYQEGEKKKNKIQGHFSVHSWKHRREKQKVQEWNKGEQEASSQWSCIRKGLKSPFLQWCSERNCFTALAFGFTSPGTEQSERFISSSLSKSRSPQSVPALPVILSWLVAWTLAGAGLEAALLMLMLWVCRAGWRGVIFLQAHGN